MSDRWNKDSFGSGLLERGECRDEAAQLAISSYLDGEADAEERGQAEQHLSACPVCQSRALNWQEVGRMLGSHRYTEGPTYQIQAQVREGLTTFLQKETARTEKATARPKRPGLAFTGGVVALGAIVVCTFLVARLTLGNAFSFEATTTPLSVTMAVASPVRAYRSFNPLGTTRLSTATPTITANTAIGLPLNLDSALKNARVYREYPAAAGRFAGFSAIVAWYADNTNRLWIVDPAQNEREVSLSELSEATEPVRFYYDDPQTVLWSERGAIVSYHLSDAKVNEWGLVVPQTGPISAARLVQPPTAAALSRITTSPNRSNN